MFFQDIDVRYAHLLFAASVFSVGFPFFLPFGLFKKGRAVIHLIVERIGVDYSNARIAIMLLLVICLGILLFEGTSENLRAVLLFPTWFIIGIMAMDGMRRAH